MCPFTAHHNTDSGIARATKACPQPQHSTLRLFLLAWVIRKQWASGVAYSLLEHFNITLLNLFMQLCHAWSLTYSLKLVQVEGRCICQAFEGCQRQKHRLCDSEDFWISPSDRHTCMPWPPQFSRSVEVWGMR